MTNTTEANIQLATDAGTERGTAAGSWVLDGNSSIVSARGIRKGYDDGDPAIMDLCPSPLSGEWAGESIPELSVEYGIDLEDSDIADAFETAFADAFWAETIRTATAIIDG